MKWLSWCFRATARSLNLSTFIILHPHTAQAGRTEVILYMRVILYTWEPSWVIPKRRNRLTRASAWLNCCYLSDDVLVEYACFNQAAAARQSGKTCPLQLLSYWYSFRSSKAGQYADQGCPLAFGSLCSIRHTVQNCGMLPNIQNPNSWTYNFVEVSGHNLESFQTWGFHKQYLHYKPVSNNFCGGGGGVKSVSICDHRVHRVVTSAFWRTFIHECKISLGWWGWGVHAHPLLLHLPSPVKLQCTLQLSGQIHWPCFISCKDIYSVFVTVNSKEENSLS